MAGLAPAIHIRNQREGDFCEQMLEQLSCAVVQASWHDEPTEPGEIEAVPVVCAAIDEPLALGMTQLVWHCASVELHDMMQVVTAEVTFVVCGVTGVKGCDCASAALQPRAADASAAATATTIAPHRMIVSSNSPVALQSDGSHHTRR
jgi:hypothetical protein